MMTDLPECLGCGRKMASDNTTKRSMLTPRSNTNPDYCKTCVGRRVI